MGPAEEVPGWSARERMKAHGLGALLLMYDENVRYVASTLTPGWNRLKPGLRYALLCGDDSGPIRTLRRNRNAAAAPRCGSCLWSFQASPAVSMASMIRA